MARILASIFLFTLLLVGCGQADPVGGKQRKKYYRNVISLSPNTTEIMSAIMVNLQIVGKTAACDYPPGVKGIPIVANVKPDYEQIAKIRPDIIVYDASLYNSADIEKLKQLNIELYEFKANTIDEFEEWLVKAGTKFAGETEVSEYVDKIDSARRENLAEGGPKRRVLMVLGGNAGEYMAAGTQTIQSDFVRGCGYELVGPNEGKFATINAEEIVRLNPDVIMVVGDPARLTTDPRLKSLAAIRGKKVLAITDQNMVLRAGYRVDACLTTLRASVEGLYKGTK